MILRKCFGTKEFAEESRMCKSCQNYTECSYAREGVDIDYEKI